VLLRLEVTVAGVYRQLYRHSSEPLEPMAPVDRAAWARARETVHIYGDTRVRAVWMHLKRGTRVTDLRQTHSVFLCVYNTGLGYFYRRMKRRRPSGIVSRHARHGIRPHSPSP
jgi:(2Fe-2S) ferredoxin